MTQDMKHSIRFIILFLTLTFGMGQVWAEGLQDNITINPVLPNSSAGTVTIKSVSDRTVTLTVTPADGFKIKKSLIIVEKMVNPTRSSSNVGRFTLTGTDEWVTAATDYSFEVGTDYDGAYITARFASSSPNVIASLDEISDFTEAANYELGVDVDASSFTGFKDANNNPIEFAGTLDGGYHTIHNLRCPLFNSTNGAVIKNVMLEDVMISQDGPVGALTGTANGYTRIYNCGILPNNNKYTAQTETSYLQSSGGTNSYCGGLVGWLKDDSRVINCFSYANITGGTDAAGIVGHNDFASTTAVTDGKYTALKTAVVNCMFYGNISGGTNTYPVYGGAKMLNNTTTGINNYDFYRAESNINPTDYNCSWPAKEEYLTKYEYYRYLLNSNRELCGWWVGAPSAPSEMSTTDVQAVPKDASLMAKWVLDPSIAPYPVLKRAGRYPSMVNQAPRPDETNPQRIDPETKQWVSRASSTNTEMKNPNAAPETDGRSLGKIKVTIKKNSTDAGTDKDIIITAMDIENNDFCYGKIQLPYYNSIFGDPSVEITGTTDAEKKSQWASRYGGNYGDKVVVGWEITSVTGGTPGNFIKEDTEEVKAWESGFNFADRNCTDKDKERVFAQGGYYYVPYGVKEITITAKWADATYLDNNDSYYDRVSVSSITNGTASSTFSPFAPAGTRSTTLANGKTVRTGAILSNLLSGGVYEKAIVLVGNNQNFTGNKGYGNKDNGFTVMSADFDLDDEPDYSLIWQLGNQTSRYSICPIRFDFLPVIEMGMAIKEDGSTQYYSLGCYRPLGHFEVTETSLIHFGQFEFGNKDRSLEAPLILNGGIYDQYTKGTLGKASADDKINYIIIGGNARIPSLTPGAHPSTRAEAVQPTRHCALNVIGGNIDYLYLTGNYNEGITPNQDNPHCYIDGGNFKQVAAAGKEGIDGDVFFNINHSVIEEFYGGSTMDQSTGNNFKTVKGNINVTVDNSKITKYCGGPKFGNMADGKTVTTHASGTTFGVYYGGGNGGTSYVQYASTDYTESNAQNPYDWNNGSKGNLNSYTPKTYRSGDKNYMADYEMEIVNSSAGTDANKGIFRTYFFAAQFSATNTGPITNNLTDCKVLTSFYGGGNLGGVIGDVESTLTDTEVMGSAFGAGYSASVPEVTIYNKNKTAPTLNVYTGIITPTPDPDPNSTSTTYTWCYKNKTTNVVIPAGVVIPDGVGTGNPTFEYEGKKYFYTEEPLENLGTVTGKATLNIEGTTTIKHSAYGGGEESSVDGNTEVKVKGGTIGTENLGGAEYGNVYGGGKGSIRDVRHGLVKGNTKVTIENTGTGNDKIVPFIRHNVYGGGAYGSVGTFTYESDAADAAITGYTSGGKAEVIIAGGTFGTTGSSNGMIFGSSRGDVGAEGSIHDKLAWVYETDVKIGTSGSGSVFTTPTVKGSVYGGGENGHVFNDAVVYIYSGTVGIPTGEEIDNQSGASYPYRGNVYGAGCGTDKYYTDLTNVQDPTDGNGNAYNPLAGIVQGNTTVNISGGHVVRNVYGAGAMGSVGTASVATSGKTTVTVSGGRIGYDGNSNNDGNIFGAARGDLAATGDLALVRETEVNINYATTPTADNEDKNVQLIAGSVFGGGEAGKVKGSVAVNMTGGLILKDLYGGGALADTQTSNWDATANSGAGGWADTNAKSTQHTTTVRATGGIVKEEIYGGALGEAGTQQNSTGKPAYVWGDVLVELNNGVANNKKGCAVGQVFGCNNINGTPKGNVTVHVYGTQNKDASKTTIGAKFSLDKIDLEKGNNETNAEYLSRLKTYLAGRIDLAKALSIATATYQDTYDNSSDASAVKTAINGINEEINDKGSATINALRYDVKAVYGGGNQAIYDPVTTWNGTAGSKTQVIIDGCSATSIETVYGGGNAAAVPETNVTVNATYEIGNVFGGGNGKDDIAPGIANPGADVGTKDHGASTANNYGTGNANTVLKGGLIHEVYGGSNQKGIIKGSINQTTNPDGSTCELEMDKVVGAGKYADIDGDVNMTLSCQPSSKVDLLFAGADEANVNGNITLNITNGHFGKVFGGNNLGGAVKGKITVNVEETGCQPIKIDELYLGGNEAAYSIYGYYESDETQTATGKKILKPRTSATDSRLPVKPDGTEYASIDAFTNYAQPELNIISCTYIGNVFGGGYGEGAVMYANPTVNVNLVPGLYADGVPEMMNSLGLSADAYANPNNVGIIRNVYGGGNAANVEGNTTVNIGTESGKSAYIIGNVFGGGKGKDDTYECEKAMVNGAIGTTVNIYNGWIKGTVYGGGEIGRVEHNTAVNIGTGEGAAQNGTSTPVVKGSVFGAGKGKNTHGYAALVRGNATVTIEGNATIGQSVYGGGEIASVGKYKVKKGQNIPESAPDDVEIGMPYSTNEGGVCNVIVKGYAEIGPDNMQMKATGGPDDTGYVFGAGKGILPYEKLGNDNIPKRMTFDNSGDYYEEYTAEWYGNNSHPDTNRGTDYVGNYLKYIETLALATTTNVTIGGHAFIKGSVYGGSENGHVQADTHVKIQEHCQIGAGDGVTERYNEADFINPATAAATDIEAKAGILQECAHWDYKSPYEPYDRDNATTGGAVTATDGHTFYGNVFGGGSGLYPYKKPDNSYEWLRSAGRVYGNTNVEITGGHILTSVYGGCELTDVGNGVSVETNKGRCFVKMSGGTLGVPRTLAQIAAHPVTCYLFGAGKGDQRVHFDQWTNVGKVRVEINDSISQPIIYGSAFGGGEDGHVLGDVSIDIKTMNGNDPVIGTWGTSYVDGNVFGGGRGFGGDALTAGVVSGNVYINISGGKMLGSIYGGGRLGSVGTYLVPSDKTQKYGQFIPDGKQQTINEVSMGNGDVDVSDATGVTHGHVTINISGGTIGNRYEYACYAPNTTIDKTANHIPYTEFDATSNRLTHTKGGNVFAGAMGRFYGLDGSTVLPRWIDLGKVKSTKLNISGSAVIKSSIYGGGELGWTSGTHKTSDNKDVSTEISITGGTIGSEITDNNVVQYTYGSVFGGGYGSTIEKLNVTDDPNTENDNPKFVAGLVHGDTKIVMQGGKVLASVYGGGEVASVNGSADVAVSGGEVGKDKVGDKQFGGPTMGNVYGGGSGHPNIVRCGRILNNTKVTISGADTKIYHNVYGGGAYGTVGDFNYTTSTDDGKVNGVTGLKTANTGKAEVIITGGTIGIDGHENGMVFGSSRGDIDKPGERDDHTAWVYDAKVTIGTSGSDAGPAIKGSIYGSGENGHTFNNAEVTVHSGTVGVATDASYPYRGNVYGGGCGTDKYYSSTIPDDHTAHDGQGDTYNPLAGIVYGNTTVTIDGGTIVRNVYGAGAMGSVGKYDANGVITSGGKTTIKINGGRVGYDGNDNGNVYGAARGDANATQTGISQVKETDVKIQYANTPTGDNEGKTEKLVAGSVFGGGQSGIVQGSVAVNMTGGLVLHDVYGGGALANTNTETSSTVPYTTAVNLYGGLVKGDAYGGGLGQLAVAAVNYTQAEADAYNTANSLSSEDAGYVTTSTVKTSAVPAVPALVYGNVTVNLGNAGRTAATAFDVNKYTGGTHDGIVKSGRVFGCNNLNGSPQGTVTVTVNKTVKGNTDKTASGDIKSEDATKHSYHVAAVYGGGNLAGKTVGGSTNVVINGCDVSIRDVYGGGNAAEVPATDVVVNGSYEIEHVFGGGNGKDDYTLDGGATWITNPGANVNGNTNTLLLGGLIHEAYGGSNEKGTITGSVSINTASGQPADCSDCPLDVEKIVGAGKNADVEGNLIMVLGCKPTTKTPLVFGGADNANVNGNVELTITSGTFGKVFGGNNLGGVIKGHIILNIEETGCNPINIDELYLGGNQAAYSAFGYNEDGSCKTSGNKAYDDPVLNVVSCTSIGKVFGGGWGAGAFMHANPTVNINMVPGAFASQLGGAHALGAIGDVYGGGNAADVYGDATVNIGTATKVRYHQSVTNGVYTMSDEMNVEGANITGDVFGGGYSADVKGNTQVNICAVKSGDTYTDVTIAGTDYHGVKILGSVYGGGDLGSVGTFTYTDATHNGKNPGSVLAAGKPTGFTANTGKCLVAIMGNAEIGPDNMKMYHSEITDGTDKPDDKGHVFGAGKGKLEAPSATSNVEYISYVDNTVVTISGNAFVKGSVYGGSENGHVLHDTYVNIQGGQIGCGKNTTARHPDEVWGDTYTATANTELWCPSWEYESPYAPYDPNANATGDLDKYSNGVSTEGGRRIASDGHSYFGNVFGGGSGSVPYFDTTAGISKYLSSAGTVEGNTHVTISGGHILTSVYGGCETTNVKGTANVTMTGGTIGVPRTDTQIQNHPVIGYLFGAGKGDQRIFFNKETNVNDAVVKVEGGRIYGSVYGGGEDGHVFRNVELTIGKADHTGPTIGTKGTSYYDGHVFGGGRGFGGEALTAGNVGGAVDVKIDGGSVLGSVYGGGRLASVGYGLYLTTENGYGVMREDNQYDGSYTNPSTLEASEYYTKGRGYITVDINGGTIGNDDANDNYGGNVYGGSMGRHTKLDGTEFPESHWSLLATAKQTIVNITGGTINRSVYGGGEAGPVRNNVTVNVDGGSIMQDVYGGGALANTNVANWNATANTWAEGKTSASYTTAVNLHGGTIGRNVYGGGLGKMAVGTPNTEGYVPGVEAKVYGNTAVELNGKVVVVDAVNTYPDDCVVKGNIFGCNNLNGSPQGTTTVHIYKTQDWDGHTKTAAASLDDPDDSHHTYNVAAVYGGGNLAAYKPVDLANATTNVIIDGCGLTSIKQVYAGGNAASVPASKVTVNATYEIEEVFGGGNGKDDIVINNETKPNPGANVGFYDYSAVEATYPTKQARQAEAFVNTYTYGTGKAAVNIFGGTIHRVFGGSNTKGNVRQSAITMLEDAEVCAFCVDEAYGGGKSAPMDAEAKLLMACIPGLREVYGGAEAADVYDDVSVTITNGTFDRVFGGNNLSGTIRGKITVNVEETGCRPVIIGELYGGGNQAGYSVYGYDGDGKVIESGENPLYADPQVNVRSFTSIGNIYGGGYGAGAKMVGNPTVIINVAEGEKKDYTYENDHSTYRDANNENVPYYDANGFKELTLTVDGHQVTLPNHKAGTIGAINNVFGGGNAAEVVGNTNVNIGTEVGNDVYMEVVVPKSATSVAGYYTRSGAGTTESPYTYTEATGAPADGTTYYKKYTIKGADIRGNVYGGGNNAAVTGNTNVTIGKKKVGE